MVKVWALVALLAHANQVHAQAPSLHLGITQEAVDEFGDTLEGTAPGASSFGITPVSGDLVQVLDATAGILPPTTEGQPHFINTVLATARIGDGVRPTDPRSGKFGLTLPHTPTGPIFVRVFNASTTEAASFYGESQVYTAASSERLIATILATDKALDTDDDDNDGLHNSWEKSHGSDSGKDDSDGDGVTDYDEHLAGTDLTDGTSYLSICDIAASPEGLSITWCSTPTTSYQVEFADSPATEHAFSVLSTTITASATTTVITLPHNTQAGYFRVSLVQP